VDTLILGVTSEEGVLMGRPRKYSLEFGEQAVELVRATGKTVAQVAPDLSINDTTLGNWVKADSAERGVPDSIGLLPLTAAERAELTKLRRENAKLKVERDLEKSGLLRDGVDEVTRFAFIDRQKALYDVTVLCSLLKVSRSGFYAWLSRPKSPRALADEVLTEQIREAFNSNRKVYGSPRIHTELADDGVHVGRKRVARLRPTSWAVTGASGRSRSPSRTRRRRRRRTWWTATSLPRGRRWSGSVAGRTWWSADPPGLARCSCSRPSASKPSNKTSLFGNEDEVRRRYTGRYLPGRALYRQRENPLDHADVLIDNSEAERPRVVRWRNRGL